MEFRWPALIALWTLLCGPIFGGNSPGSAAKVKERPAAVAPMPTAPVENVAQPKP
jgi:hypothetical protein